MTPPPFWNFSENSSVLEGEGVPKLEFEQQKSLLFLNFIAFVVGFSGLVGGRQRGVGGVVCALGN